MRRRHGGAVDLRLDRPGVLELAGATVYLAVAAAVAALQVVVGIRDAGPYTPTAWWIAVGVGVLIGAASGLGIRFVWRRRGGRRLMRAASHAVRTGEPPATLAARFAVLRELERRARALDRVPLAVMAALWTVFLLLRIAEEHTPLDLIAALLLWLAIVGITIVDVVDRRRRPRLERMIEVLRRDPYPVPTGQAVGARSGTAPAR